MRSPKVLHRLGGAASVRQRHIIAALMLTSVTAALLIAFTVPQRALIISSSSSADLDSLTPHPLSNLSDWTSPLFSNDDDLPELEADSTKVVNSTFHLISDRSTKVSFQMQELKSMQRHWSYMEFLLHEVDPCYCDCMQIVPVQLL